MKELKQLSKRLRAVTNLSEFSRKHKLLYRTLTRIRRQDGEEYVPSYSTALAITRALNKEKIPQ